MQVKCIAECSKGSILQYFRPSLSYLQGEHSAILMTFIKLPLSLKSLFCLFLSGHFTQALLYIKTSPTDDKNENWTKLGGLFLQVSPSLSFGFMQNEEVYEFTLSSPVTNCLPFEEAKPGSIATDFTGRSKFTLWLLSELYRPVTFTWNSIFIGPDKQIFRAWNCEYFLIC